jgi:hypothetical protein
MDRGIARMLPASPASIVLLIDRTPSGGRGRSTSMNGHDVTENTASPARRACLVDGCTCKDARIMSTRRASYFASVAKARGETSDRFVEFDLSWALPVWSEPDLEPEMTTHLDAAA